MANQVAERQQQQQQQQHQPQRSEVVDPVAERMRRLAEQMFTQLGSPALLAEAAAWTPLVDIEEEDDAYVLEVEVPGVKKDDVNIELIGNELMISGEIKERERQGIMRRRTRRVGRFDYRVMLPSQVDAGKIDAKLTEGVLTVRVPKMTQGRKRIEVKAS